MPQFDTSSFYSQIFWLITIFGFLYIIISNYIVPNAEQIFNNRKNMVDNELKESETLIKTTEELKEIYNKEIKSISDISEEIKKNALLTFNAVFLEKKQELDHEIENYTIQSKEEIEEAVKSFRLDEPIICINIAETIIEKISSKEPDQALLKESYFKVK